MAMKGGSGLFECVECGYQSLKYFGRCPQCQAWNSFVEVAGEDQAPAAAVLDAAAKPIKISEIDKSKTERLRTGISEFDRALGGGLVPQSVVLIGGEPGVGKSTLLLQVSAALAKLKRRVLYYSGEESATQIKLRSERLGIDSDNILLLTSGGIEDVQQQCRELRPDILIVDSIQTVYSNKAKQNSGSVTALRQLTAQLIELAKKGSTTVFIIGHITKEGQLAGPKTLEHMVDAVLYFQGEMQTDVRILRAEKNRFGPLDEIGVFQMTEKGLASVQDPSQLFIQHRKTGDAGISVFPAIGGLRTFLLEVQALVADSPFAGNPRRIAIGFDNYRMAMLISVVEKKLKLPFYKSDVFLNITSGMMVRETAADLAICAALISSYKNFQVKPNCIFLGEVGLTGEIRPVSYLENRLKEAIRQGFSILFLPESQAQLKGYKEAQIIPVANIYDLLNRLKA